MMREQELVALAGYPLLSPFFKRIDSHETRAKVCADPQPCIVLATSGMLTGGPSAGWTELSTGSKIPSLNVP